MANEGVLIRSVRRKDVESLRTLARESVIFHLPAEEKSLAGIVNIAVNSFRGLIDNQSQRSYIFVGEDLRTRDIIGCSMLFPKRGGRNSLLYVFKLATVSKRPELLDDSFEYAFLQLTPLETNYTELGGLAVLKSNRNSNLKIGTQLSIVRFIFLSMCDLYRDNLLVQLTPPFLKSGENVFWESIGRRFINMDPRRAETLNASTKNAVLALFPREPIYVCLLGKRFSRYFNRIDKDAAPASRILTKLGFRKLDMFNPFDGGCYLTGSGQCNPFLAPPRYYRIDYTKEQEHTNSGFVSFLSEGRFLSTYARTRVSGRKLLVCPDLETALKIPPGSKVVFYEYNLYSSEVMPNDGNRLRL